MSVETVNLSKKCLIKFLYYLYGLLNLQEIGSRGNKKKIHIFFIERKVLFIEKKQSGVHSKTETRNSKV